jgi:hypothetical protein
VVRRAHTTHDPIFAAVHKVRSAREGAELVAMNCAKWHSPTGGRPELADLGVTCSTCHQTKAVDGSGGKMGFAAFVMTADHEIAGPHGKDIVAGALDLHVAFDGDLLMVTLENKTSHGYPIGFPGRFAVLSLVGYDAAEEEVWRNFRDDPMKEHPEAVLNKVYLDGEGQPTLAPWAKTLARDSRLKTGETRLISVAVPPEVKRVEAKLGSRLVAPPLARTLGLGEWLELKPGVVKKAEAKR